MGNWMAFRNPEDVKEKKSSIFKDYVLPIGALLIPTISFLAQNNSSWWGSLAIAAYVVIVLIFLVVPAIIQGVKKWNAYLKRRQFESNYLPKIFASLRRFQPLMEPNHSDTVWGVWDSASRTSEMQKFIRPSHSHYYTLSAWLEHLLPTISTSTSKNFKLVTSETSAWVQQYVSFCRDGYYQFEFLLQSGQFDESKVREIKQSWNNARDEHNQAITNWKTLCLEVNTSFGENIFNAHYETLKTLE